MPITPSWSSTTTVLRRYRTRAGQFVALVEAIPEPIRHLELHRGHLTTMNPIDRQVLTPAAAAALSPLTGTAQQLQTKARELSAAGITEIAFQPVGDVPGELEAMADALGEWMQ